MGTRTAVVREVVNCPDATPTPAAATVSREKKALPGFMEGLSAASSVGVSCLGSYHDGVVFCRRILVAMRRRCCVWADHNGKSERRRNGWLCVTVWL